MWQKTTATNANKRLNRLLHIYIYSDLSYSLEKAKSSVRASSSTFERTQQKRKDNAFSSYIIYKCDLAFLFCFLSYCYGLIIADDCIAVICYVILSVIRRNLMSFCVCFFVVLFVQLLEAPITT